MHVIPHAEQQAQYILYITQIMQTHSESANGQIYVTRLSQASTGGVLLTSYL